MKGFVSFDFLFSSFVICIELFFIPESVMVLCPALRQIESHTYLHCFSLDLNCYGVCEDLRSCFVVISIYQKFGDEELTKQFPNATVVHFTCSWHHRSSENISLAFILWGKVKYQAPKIFTTDDANNLHGYWHCHKCLHFRPQRHIQTRQALSPAHITVWRLYCCT